MKHVLFVTRGLFMTRPIHTLCACISAITASSLHAYIPSCTSKVLIALQKQSGGLHALATLLAVTIIMGLITSIRGRIFCIIGDNGNIWLNKLLFETLLKNRELHRTLLEDVKAPKDIHTYVHGMSTKISNQWSLQINVGLRTIIQLLSILYFMFGLHVKMASGMLLFVPTLWWVSEKAASKHHIAYMERQTALDKANAYTTESLRLLPLIQGFASEKMVLNAYSRYAATFLTSMENYSRVYALWAFASIMIPQTLIVSVFGMGYIWGVNADILIAFFLYQQQFFDVCKGLFEMRGNWNETRAIFEQMAPLLEETIKNNQKNTEYLDGLINYAKYEGTLLALTGVKFAYPCKQIDKKEYVLQNLCIKVPSFSHIAVIGKNGSGKSTLIQLIQGFYEPCEGTLQFMQRSLKEYDREWLHQRIVCVQQFPLFWKATIRENLLHGLQCESSKANTLIKDDSIWSILKDIGCDIWVRELPEGLDTMIEPDAANVSGGQKQKLALARALLRKPWLLILDEALSAMDTPSRMMITALLQKKVSAKELTLLSIAHYLETVKDCDQIYIVDGGKIVLSETPKNIVLSGKASWFLEGSLIE